MQQLTQGGMLNPGGKFAKEKGSTGQRLTPKERAKNRKDRERELRRKKREERKKK
jgi:signal recognition particle subunit SRP54